MEYIGFIHRGLRGHLFYFFFPAPGPSAAAAAAYHWCLCAGDRAGGGSDPAHRVY